MEFSISMCFGGEYELLVICYRVLARALGSDESGETMDALDLYNQALSTIRSGLAVLRSSVGAEPEADSALHDIKAKMEK